MTTVIDLEMSHLNARSHAFHPLFNVGEHDIFLSIFQTDFLFRTFDILVFFPMCAICVNGVYRVS